MYCIILEIDDGLAETRKLQPVLETKICRAAKLVTEAMKFQYSG